MAQPVIDVVLATYNGEAYLAQQLDSLLNQTLAISRIIVGDDGSSDATLSILRDYQHRFLNIEILPRRDEVVARGASANFSRLLAASTARYVFLCDQDDLWDADKVERCVDAMRQLEHSHGDETPLLVHTDLRLIDGQGGLMTPSMFSYQHLDPRLATLKDLLCQSAVTGCAAMINRALIDKALPVHPDAVMHDWWLSLVAAAFGKIGFVERATVSYRQHGQNTVGAKQWGLGLIKGRAQKLLTPSGAAKLLWPSLRQAKAFAGVYGGQLDARTRLMVERVAALNETQRLSRICTAAKYRLHKHGSLRTLGFYWALGVAQFTQQ